MKTGIMLLLAAALFSCDIRQAITGGSQISIVSQNLEIDTFGLETYFYDTSVSRDDFDKLIARGDVYGGICTNDRCSVTMKGVRYNYLRKEFKIVFENRGFDTAYNVSFSLKIQRPSASTTRSVFALYELPPGFRASCSFSLESDDESAEVTGTDFD